MSQNKKSWILEKRRLEIKAEMWEMKKQSGELPHFEEKEEELPILPRVLPLNLAGIHECKFAEIEPLAKIKRKQRRLKKTEIKAKRRARLSEPLAKIKRKQRRLKKTEIKAKRRARLLKYFTPSFVANLETREEGEEEEEDARHPVQNTEYQRYFNARPAEINKYHQSKYHKSKVICTKHQVKK